MENDDIRLVSTSDLNALVLPGDQAKHGEANHMPDAYERELDILFDLGLVQWDEGTVEDVLRLSPFGRFVLGALLYHDTPDSCADCQEKTGQESQ